MRSKETTTTTTVIANEAVTAGISGSTTSNNSNNNNNDTNNINNNINNNSSSSTNALNNSKTKFKTAEIIDRPRTPPPTGPIIELRSREVIFAILIFFLLAVVTGLIVVLSSYQMKNLSMTVGDARPVEKRGEKKQFCQNTGSSRRMDFSAHPCDDFWKYSCGRFLAENKIPEGKGSIGLDDMAINQTKRIIETVIRSDIADNHRTNPDSAVRKMKQFYDTCTLGNKTKLKKFDGLMKHAGTWLKYDKEINVQRMLTLLIIELDLQALFSMAITKQALVKDTNIIMVN
ncbi:hypothetical protein HELRODRAFT_181595 [Helobdella robusta]|uniref:Peptidase M13 N-terminal domain-containing protein n=1 Tax=Helobdella robusta TaxID=6412 RepID=T1FH54_HELRO|nr:hypothetical protein HELRODRAFT_181595 [Helobdella robusta]ESN92256.1 hypothetical protein HELRODRAFT_181595 [Helobdella robusta]